MTIGSVQANYLLCLHENPLTLGIERLSLRQAQLLRQSLLPLAIIWLWLVAYKAKGGTVLQ